MRLLIDQNMAVRVAILLRDGGHDAVIEDVIGIEAKASLGQPFKPIPFIP